ncbi:MAG TPA: phosphoribosylaminoimidazolesuccinocarboxamide synthase, partial [candidate division Zixibacteria bacterium]
LTQMSLFWFDFVEDIIPNHLITSEVHKFPKELQKSRDQLEGRSMLVKKAQRMDVECVARGYISGSLWKEYKEIMWSAEEGKDVKIHGIPFPYGLKESEKLPNPIFTPATKEKTGHDENISFKKTEEILGRELAGFLKEKSIAIYKKARDYAEERGIIIADTKFEFGILNDKIILIDEILSPDSSRFWSKSNYKVGKPQDSFDKQYVRDYLESINWNKKPPAPELPEVIIENTLKKYQQAYQALISKK